MAASEKYFNPNMWGRDSDRGIILARVNQGGRPLCGDDIWAQTRKWEEASCENIWENIPGKYSRKIMFR